MGGVRVIVRRADLADCERADGVLKSFGLGVARRPEDVARWWDWIWTRNPARMAGRPQPPPGWVLEVDGEPQGFFGNIPARYRLGDETLVTAIASHWAVREPFRSHTRKLREAWFGQAEAELQLVSTGVEATGRIFLRHGASAMPNADYRRVLFWVLDGAALAESTLRQRGVGRPLARLGGAAVGPVLASLSMLQRRRPGCPRAGVEPEAIALDDVGDEFDDLWLRVAGGHRRLLAYRRAEDLRWHFEPRPADVTILRCRRSGCLDGYLVLLREVLPDLGLVRLKIVDLIVANDDAQIVDALLAAAWERTRELGGHVLELVGFPREIRERAQSARPFARLYPVHPFFYRARSPALHRLLEAPEHWYPTLYDGDGCLGSLPG